MESATFDLYRDIAERTDGDVYLGVVGPDGQKHLYHPPDGIAGDAQNPRRRAQRAHCG